MSDGINVPGSKFCIPPAAAKYIDAFIGGPYMYSMDPTAQRVLNGYEARCAEETRRWHSQEWNDFVKERDQFLLAVGPATGQFMNVLIREAKSKVILEIGTSYGYSTLWLAEAARAGAGQPQGRRDGAGRDRRGYRHAHRAGRGPRTAEEARGDRQRG